MSKAVHGGMFGTSQKVLLNADKLDCGKFQICDQNCTLWFEQS